MNLKKLFLMLTFFVLLGTTAFAQQTWYVNNGPTGNDGRNGLSATIPVPDDFVTGPKKTINNVISYANASDVVVVASTGVDYGTGTGEPATLAISKALFFQSTGGSVNIASTFQVITGALATKVTFNSGAFALKGGLTLTSGTLDNSAGLVTVNGNTITVAAVVTTTKVTGQLAYSGTVNFSYGATYTAADEFPASGTIGTLTTTAGNLTLKTTTLTVSGAITTAGTLDLGGNTVTRTNTAVQTDAFTGNVTNGTLAYSLGDGNVAITGAVSIPSVTASTSTTTARSLDINGPTALTGTLSVSGKASVASSGNTLVTLGTSGYSGDVLTLSGTGAVALGTGLATVHGNVALTSTGLNATNAAQIAFNNAGALTINGNVTNSAAVVLSSAAVQDAGLINFSTAGQALTINGSVTANGALSGSTAAATDYFNNGEIRFANTASLVTITGAVTNSATSTAALGAAVGTKVSTNYRITFASTSGNTVTGGFVNSSAIPAVGTGVTNTGNGTILFTGRTTGTIGTLASRTGLVSNTSLSTITSNGLIDFLATATGAFYGTDIVQGTGADGGDITFGDHLLDITGNITNGRTVAGVDIVVPVGAATVTHAIAGYVLNSGKSMISIDLTGNDIVGITGRVESSSTTGSVTFPNAGAGALSFGGLVVSAGTVSIPATNNAGLTINGAVNISGGTASLLADGGDAIVVSGDASFTGGTITTTGRSAWTLNSVNITVGGATANPTFATNTEFIVGVPAPVQLANFVVGPANPTIPGALTVNSSGLAKAVEFTGGSMKIAGLLTFQAGKVHLAGAVNLIAQLAADPSFTNTAGYTTDDNARISINATGGDPGVRGPGDFGNLEFNSQGQTTIVGNGGSAGILVKGTVYLTAGPVNNGIGGQPLTFNNSTTLPTIVRNAGYFLAVPTFTSNVNVTYIGGDKASGNELPVSPSTKLQNLTVATSIGNVAGKGVVTVGSNTIVNGTINVYANQTLLIDAVTLTMKGAAITLNGDIANEGVGNLTFGATAGTTVTGAGYLPNLVIAAGSTGNVIAGTAIINQLVGTDNMRNTAGDDFDATTTAAQGTVTFLAGTNSATFTLVGVAFDGSMAGAVTTNDTGNTMVLGGNFVSTGTLTHTSGTINIGAFTYEQRGATITLGTTANSTWTGTGKLYLYQKDATTNTPFTLNSTTASTIAVNVELKNADATGAEDDLILATAPLTISGTLTLTDGELVLGRNLTLTGTAFTITSAATVSGASVLSLNAAVAPLTMSYTGTPTISNLTISNDVNLAGTGTALTISTLFTHDGGVLNFGTKDLTFQTAFTRTAGTAAYMSTTGYMIWDGSAGSALAVTQGTDGFSVPNLRITNSGANNVALNAGATQGTVTVTGAFDLANGVTTTQTFTTNGKFAIADAATVNYTSGLVSAAPAYAGSVTMVGKTFLTGEAFPALLWPSTGVTVTTLTINGAAAVNTIALPGDRTVTTALNLTKGVLALGANTLTLGTGSTIYRTDAGSVTVGAGGFAFPSDNTTNVTYYANAAGIGSGIELPATLNNLTVSRSANGANQVVTVNSSVAVNGTLTIKNNFTIPAAPPVVTVTANGNVSIVNDAATYALATNPVLTNGQSLVIGGAGDQTVTVPNATPALNIGAITINKTSGNVILAGGNLATGTITFTNGNIITNAFVLYIPAPTTALVAGGAQSQGFIGAGATSMVVGNVAKTLVNTGGIGTSTESVNVFPVGTGVVYRPATLTFNPAFGVPTTPNATIVVSHVDSNPGGSQALPIANGVATGIDVSRYPNFYWNIYTIGSVGQSTVFDLGLTAGNFTDYDSPTNVRIIRRHGAVGDINNDWLLQGLNTGYDNEVNSVTGFTAINRNSVGGLRTGGAVFTLGVKSNMSVANPIEKQWLATVVGPVTLPLADVFQGNIGELSFLAQSSNTAVATAVISGTNVILTPIATNGQSAFVTITAVDADNNDFLTYTFEVDSRTTDVESVEAIPTEFALMQNFPNPFNPTTNIKFALPTESNVTLKIYNILGEEVANLINKVMPAGYHTINFDAAKLSSGMYIYRIEAGSFVQVKKMLLMK